MKKIYSYEEFPESQSYCEGMRVINGNQKNIEPAIQEQMIYTTHDNIPLHLIFIFPQELKLKRYPARICMA